MQKSPFFLLFLVLTFFVNAITVNGQQKLIPFSNALNGNVDGYAEYLPADYQTSGKNYPLLLFLHGAGEAGSQGPLSLVTKNGPPSLIAAGAFPSSFTVNGVSYSFIVISPQFINWPVAADVDAMLQYVEAHYRVDASRIYLTGLSMGGGATWDYAQQSQYGSKLAAISPIAGAQPPSVSGGCNIAGEKLGVWAFNNSNDPAVPPWYTTDWVSYINACNPPVPAKHTIFNANGHGGWVTAYDPNYTENGLNLYQYLLQFQKGKSASQPPVANVGNSQTIMLPNNTITLDGSASTDQSGTITTYNWQMVSGPNGFQFRGSSSATQVVNNLIAGNYIFQLTVTDNLGNSGSAQLKVTVNSALPPVANAGSPQTISLPVNSVTLDGSGSSDRSGTITGYAWTLSSGPNGFHFAGSSSVNPTVTGLIAGNYVFKLTVTDNLGNSGNANVSITVNPASLPPTANAGNSQSITLPTNTATLDGSGSTDPNGGIVNYTWSLISGPRGYSFSSVSQSKVNLSKLIAGNYWFQLMVTDAIRLSDTAKVLLTVNQAPPPVANAGSPQSISLPTNQVTLDGSGSTDASGTISGYSWSLLSGPNGFSFGGSSQIKPTITNLIVGTYSFQLQVVDNLGNSGVSRVAITVNPAIQPPVANAGGAQTIMLPTNAATLDGSASTDVSGTITGYAWSLVSGPAGFTFGGANTVSTVVNNLLVGKYVFQLAVADNLGNSGTAQVSITVNPNSSSGHKTITLAGDVNHVIGIDDVTGTLHAQPGDTLCIPAGDYQYVYLGNIQGNASNPIVIKNCGGLVRIGINENYPVTFQVYKSNYFKLQGTGDSRFEYGIDISGARSLGGNSDALTIDRGSSDFEINNVYIHDANHFIVSEQRASCDHPEWWRENYVMKNISFHHIKGNNAIFEGFYIGPTSFTSTGTCGVMNNNLIENLSVYDNIVTNTGNAAIQVAMAWLGSNSIHHNYIKNFGLSNSTFQTNGMEVGGGVKADTYDNYIDTGIGNGMQVLGGGTNRVYNNIIINPGADGIQLGQRILFQPLFAELINNTIVHAGIKSISVYDTIRPNRHQLYNNLLVNQGSTFNRGVPGIDATPQVADMQNNIYLQNTVDAKFTNVGSGDYHLSAGSPAIDSGKNVSALGIINDYDGITRPYNNKYDVGGYEYHGNTGNLPPVANAGSNQTITLPVDSVFLDGRASSDPNKNIKSYFWSLVSAPSGFSFVGSGSVTTEVRKLIAGTYVFKLLVTDGFGATGSAQVTITVKPAVIIPNPPVANAGTNQTITLPINSVILDGSRSSDPDGNITRYAWTLVSGPTGYTYPGSSLAKTTVVSLVAGSYTFKLTVTDNFGLSSSAQVDVTVKRAAIDLPVAKAGADRAIKLPQDTVHLDGSGSYDLGGSIVKYNWVLISGPLGFSFSGSNEIAPVIGNLGAGGYTFQLTVTNNIGAASSDRLIVTVAPAVGHQPPFADAGPYQTIRLPQSSITLDGSGSYAFLGSITSYNWSLKSGPANFSFAGSNLAQVEVDKLIAGVYVFQLTVVDNQNASALATVTIVVNPQADYAGPLIEINGNRIITLPNNQVHLDAANSLDASGTIVYYHWVILSGPSGYKIETPDAVATNFSNLTAGTYLVQLTVKDDAGKSASYTVSVVVAPSVGDYIVLYPNPSNGQFAVTMNYSFTGNSFIHIYRATGELVKVIPFVKTSPAYSIPISLWGLAHGVYFIRVTTNGKVHYAKAVIRH